MIISKRDPDPVQCQGGTECLICGVHNVNNAYAALRVEEYYKYAVNTTLATPSRHTLLHCI